MSTKQLLGMIGSIALFIGVFLPILSIRGVDFVFFDSITYGILFLIFAVVSFLIALKDKEEEERWLFVIGCASLGIILIRFFDFRSIILKYRALGAADIAHFQWGWLVLIGGSVLLLVSALMTTEKSTD